MSNFNQKRISDFILQLIHPDYSIKTDSFPKSDIFWNNLVFYASNHLILPAILFSIKSKKLDSFVPKDLLIYLSEISEINHKRNIQVIRQIEFLSKVFKKHKIEHAFTKGAALLISRPYDTVKNRMVGDIDILVSKNDILRAQKVLLKLNFKEQKINDIELLKDIYPKKHLPRLTSKEFISAVELHLNLFERDYINLINTNEIMKQKTLTDDGYYILSKKNLWMCAVLNWQLNDGGYKRNFLSFRSVMDVIYLDPDNYFMKNYLENKYLKHFYSLMSVHLNNYPVYYPLKKLIYILNLKSKFIYLIGCYFSKSVDLCKIIFYRTLLFFKSKKYRDIIIVNNKVIFKKIINFLKI